MKMWKIYRQTDDRHQAIRKARSVVQQMEVCWTKSLKCTYCHLQSCTRKPVQKKAAQTTLPYGQPHYTTLSWEQGSKNFQTLNCQPPSISGSQRNANKVGLYQMVRDDLRRESSPAWHCGMGGCSYPSTPTHRPTSSPTSMWNPPVQVLHR